MLIKKLLKKEKLKKKIKKNFKIKSSLSKKKIYIVNTKIFLFFFYSNILEFFLLHKVLNYLMFSGKKDKAFNH